MGQGSSHAKDGIQSVGLVLVPVANLCLSQFQDHIRVTLGFSHNEGNVTGNGESAQVGQGRWEWGRSEPLAPGRWRSRYPQPKGTPGPCGRHLGWVALGTINTMGLELLITRPLESWGCRLIARTMYTRTKHS